MYFYQILHPTFKQNFNNIEKFKIIVRRITKSNYKALQKNTNEDQLPSQYNHNAVSSLSPNHMSLEKRKKMKFPSPALLPSEKEKERNFMLKEDILATEDLEQLLNIYLQSKPSFNHIHYLLTTKKLAEFYTEGKITRKLHENVIFQSICYDLWKFIPQIEAHIVLRFYKNFQLLEVSSKYLLMQGLLQMMRHQINILQLNDLIFMYELVDKTEPCNLKHALQSAIPRAVESRINMYLPPSLGFKNFTELLRICIHGQVKGLDLVLGHFHETILPLLKERKAFNSDLIQLLINLLDLLEMENDGCSFSEENFNLSRILIFHCLDELSMIDLLSINKELILNTLDKLERVFKNSKNDFVSHEGFLSNIAEKCVREIWDISSACKMIDYHLKLQYINDELVSFAVSILNENNTQLSNELHVVPLIFALAATEYPTSENEKIVHSLMNRFMVPIEDFKVSWLKFALNLLSFNYFPENMLKKILHRDYLRRYLDSRLDVQEYVYLLKLHKALKALNWNAGFQIPEELLSSSEEKYLESRPTPSLRPLVERVLGNSCCVISDVITPHKNDLDHLIILDEDGRPMPLRFDENIGYESIKLDDMTGFEGKRKIALIEVPNEWMYKPGLRPCGEIRLEHKLLEREGFEVFALYEQEMEDLQAEEVLVYMKEKLINIGCVI